MRASIGISVISLLALASCGGSVGGTGGNATTSKTTTSGSGGSGGSGGEGSGGGLPEGKCRTIADCKIGLETCAPPGSPTGCGTCFMPPSQCTTDAECGGTMICETAHCACNGEKSCVEGCTSSAACGVGESCDADHRCHPVVCAQQIDCPVNFLCPPILSARCERRACKVDPECDVGYCVEGACYDVPGSCAAPVP